MKPIYAIAAVLVVLAVVAIGAVLLLNNRPSASTEQPSNTRVRNTSVAGDNATRDPQDDSPSDEIPNVPLTPGSEDVPPVQDPLDDSVPDTNNPNTPPDASPPASGGMVSLPGTTWTAQESNETFEFCGDTWQIKDEGGTVTSAGTFEQTSTTLTFSGDGDPRTYEISWDPAASILTINQGDTPTELVYGGELSC